VQLRVLGGVGGGTAQEHRERGSRGLGSFCQVNERKLMANGRILPFATQSSPFHRGGTIK
jgi:hypothetical protein